jgi:hypothetical protein
MDTNMERRFAPVAGASLIEEEAKRLFVLF